MTLKLPLNRFITLVKPYLNVAAGGVAAWLVAKANVLGLPGLGAHQNELATGLAGGAVALVTWGAAQIGDLKWIRGHHIQLAAGPPAAPDVRAAAEELGPEHEVDHDLDSVTDLPDDETELASPPDVEADPDDPEPINATPVPPEGE